MLRSSKLTSSEDMESVDAEDIEQAKAFWDKEDVDYIFDTVLERVDHLRVAFRKKTATDKEYLQGLKLLEALDCRHQGAAQDPSVVQVVIGPGGLLLTDSTHQSPSYSCSSSEPPSCAALSPVLLEYQPHTCCKTCLSCLPSVPQSLALFWGQNPLHIPQLCGFKRLTRPESSGERRASGCDGEELLSLETLMNSCAVVYVAPCGRKLCNQDDVLDFLLDTESYNVLQVDFFTFNLSVQLDSPESLGPHRAEMDLSRGVEPTPVQLRPGHGGVTPPDFRYRKDRWPHGSLLSRGPVLFSNCCDCADGCSNAKRCACVAMTKGGRHYIHHRLDEPIPSGVYECGPWCGCERERCQNRLVQRGIRVRLQVFQTEDRGWGVRCRDDLDHGTFVCIYAGVILQRDQSLAAPPSPKHIRRDVPSDDEVEVITEWLAPSGKQEAISSPHVPVIQRPTDGKSQQEQEKALLMESSPIKVPPTEASGDPSPDQEKTVGRTTSSPEEAAGHGINGNRIPKKGPKELKRGKTVEDVHILDASKEGNVGRFINHSCNPNLFLQNVFTDSHDPAFPVIAFFTNSVVKAGTELTWKYSDDAQWKKQVPCLCSSNTCQGHFVIVENLCDACPVKSFPPLTCGRKLQ